MHPLEKEIGYLRGADDGFDNINRQCLTETTDSFPESTYLRFVYVLTLVKSLLDTPISSIAFLSPHAVLTWSEGTEEVRAKVFKTKIEIVAVCRTCTFCRNMIQKTDCRYV